MEFPFYVANITMALLMKLVETSITERLAVLSGSLYYLLLCMQKTRARLHEKAVFTSRHAACGGWSYNYLAI